MWRSTISFVNARVVTPAGEAGSMRFAGNVLSVGEPPRHHDIVVDLNGAHVLPGLVNAHDHLELNHYGRLKSRERYANVSEWIADMNPRLRHDPHIQAGQAHRLAHRLFIGGLKNLLAGVTTVAHHNPMYREIGRFCPVRVLREFGWAHSFQLEHRPVGARGEPGGDVVARHHATPQDQPFIVHLSEGVDPSAASELDRFAASACLTANAALVHAVALAAGQWNLVAERGAGLVWCPASNLYLFGATPNVRALLDDPRMRPRIALGSDSRISGARDLLEELKVASDSAPLTHQELLHLVTTGPAELLRLRSAGRIAAGRPADLMVLPRHADGPGAALLNASRKNVDLVMIAGRPLVGSPSLAQVFNARQVRTRPVVVDHTHKLMDASIARLLSRSPIGEAGVTTEADAVPRAYAFVTSR